MGVRIPLVAVVLALAAPGTGCTRPNPFYLPQGGGGGGSGSGSGGNNGGNRGGEGEGEGPAEGEGEGPVDPELRFVVTVAADPLREDERFPLSITAVDSAGSPVTDFTGTLTMTSDRGDIRPDTIHVATMPTDGVQVPVTLNREGVARIAVSARGGHVLGISAELHVKHALWVRPDDVPSPVLDRGGSGEWDDWDVSQPSVVVLRPPTRGGNGQMFMYYRGRAAPTTNMGVGMALSEDGFTWRRGVRNPVLGSEDQGARRFIDFSEPHVLIDNGKYRMWATGTTESETYIIQARSTDGLVWTRDRPAPVIRASGQADWVERWVFAPAMILSGSGYEGWYGAFTFDGVFGIGHATSVNGADWTKDAENPVLSPTPDGWDAETVDKPAVIKDGTVYRMWYTGDDVFSDSSTDEWSIGYATSSDGVHWDKSPGNPVLRPSGRQGDFDEVRVANPSAVLVPASDDPSRHVVWLYYDGYDGVRWRIGLAHQGP